MNVIAHHEIAHIEPSHRKVHPCVLLCVVSPKPLQVDHQDRRHIKHLDLFHRLLVRDALVAVPRVCLGQVLWLVKLTEAVLYRHRLLSLLIDILAASVDCLLKFGSSIQSRVQCPTPSRIELDSDLKFRTLWQRIVLDVRTATAVPSPACLLPCHFLLLFCLLFDLMRFGLVLSVVEGGLGTDARLLE